MKQGIKKEALTPEKALRLAEVGFIFDCSHIRWTRAVLKPSSDSE